MNITVKINFKNKTIQLDGPTTIENLMELIEKIPELGDFTIIPETKYVENPLINRGDNHWGGIGGQSLFYVDQSDKLPAIDPFIKTTEIFCQDNMIDALNNSSTLLTLSNGTQATVVTES